jgi:lactate dehydrogenase-like 2-hydroxyacid dehydrogenase
MSNRSKLLVLAPIPPELRARLGARYELVELGDLPGPADGFEVAVTMSIVGADAVVMAAIPDLRLIACNGTGLDRIDMSEAARRGIKVQHTPDVVTEDTADYAIALIYAVARRLVEADRFIRAGHWRKRRMTPSRRLSGKALGIVGLGKIGSSIARRAAGLGLSVRYTGPREKPESGLAYAPDIGSLAEWADILVLCCPGGPETAGLVDEKVLARLGTEGILINVARGSVVDEAALIAALADGSIAGAGLDVFAGEPDIDPCFLSMENVVLSPHYAAITRETREAMADVLEAAIDAHFGGTGP